MTDRKNHGRRWPVVGVAAGALLLSAAGVGVAQAAAAPPPIALVAAASAVTAERYTDGKNSYLYFDLGMHAIAGADPFEVRATRGSYDKPIQAKVSLVKDGKKKLVTLPADAVPDFTGVKDFTTYTITNAAGAVVASYGTPFCGNSWGSARTRRDAPATNPYPTRCGGENPFTLGAVWGVQAGWNAALTDQPTTKPLDLKAGKYTVTATLNPVIKKLFGVPGAKATAKVKMTVVEVKADAEELRQAKTRGLALSKAAGKATRAPSTKGHVHAGEGDASRQVSSYRPEFRAAAKRPATVAAVPAGPKPDLRSLPAWGISMSQGENPKTGKPTGKWYVNFGATVWNAGTSPLMVDGFRRNGTDLMDAYQYFFDTAGKQVGSRAAGTMEWDAREGHLHWHFTDFAQYNLLRADTKLAVRSGKEAFCLANTDAVDYTIPGAKWRPENTDLATSCGANTVVAVREVLDVGSGDTYSQDRPGQSFEITNLPNGSYYIQTLANPSNRLAELSTANNSSLRKIVLGGTKTKRTLSVPKVYGIAG